MTESSPVIDKGLNSGTIKYKELINNNTTYNQLVELLKVDIFNNKRIYNETIDMGTVEYKSTKYN